MMINPGSPGHLNVNVNVNINETIVSQQYSPINNNIRQANHPNRSYNYQGYLNEETSPKNSPSPRFGNTTPLNKPQNSPNP